jgi:tetratricopeptide (TPR) repeat protein
MSSDTADYDLKGIRDQLLGSFTPETFRRLFRYTDNPALRPVLTEFSPGDGLATMIDKTIDYCQTRDLLGALLREIQLAGVPTQGSTEASFAQAQRLLEQKSYDEAIRLLQRLYRIFPYNEQIEQLLLEALYAKGVHSFVAEYNLSEAGRALEEVLSIDPFYKDASRLATQVKYRVNQSLASDYARTGQFDLAIESYQQALADMEQVGDFQEIANTYLRLGLVYGRKGEWDLANEVWERAILSYRHALEYMGAMGDDPEMAEIYYNLGWLYTRKEEWDWAIECFQRALDYMEQVGDNSEMARTHRVLAECYQTQGDTDRAASHIARAYLIFTQVGAAPEAERASRFLVEILGSVDEAKSYLIQLANKSE